MTAERIALIPAYEPDEQLIWLLKTLAPTGMKPIIVDDGSGSNYAAIFHQAENWATVLVHTANLGKGTALKTGFAYILARFGQACTVVTMDCDGQHRVEDALRICDAAEARRGTLVLGSRRLRNGTPLRSRVGNTITRLVYRLATGQRVHDTQTGLRGFDGSLLPELLSIKGERYEYEMNVLLEFPRRGIPIREVEIDTIYLNQNAGSHFDAIRDSWLIYREILRFCASSFLSFVVDYSLYSLLLFLTGNLTFSNVGARMVSASVNYTLNRNLVFKSGAGVGRSALQYLLLAAFILAGNTVLLHLLVNQAQLNQWLAKIMTELIFFLLSWTVQKFVIFRKKAEKPCA